MPIYVVFFVVISLLIFFRLSRSGREDSVRLTLELSDQLCRTEDSAEGIRSFLEKREPRFEDVPETRYEGKV